MQLWTKYLAVLATIVFLTRGVFAQETGEMLKFNNAPNLEVEVKADLSRGAPDSVAYQSPASAQSREPFNRILLNGTISDSSLALQLSFRNETGKWSGWKDVTVKRFDTGRFWAKLDLKDGKTTRSIKYRWLNRGAKWPAKIEIFAVEGVNLKSAPSGESAPAKPRDDLRFSQTDTIPRPVAVTREEWGANPPIGNYVPHDPFRFAQHHTAGQRVSTLADGIAEQKFIQDFHQNARGWQDIGYHFTVDDSGRVYEGVPPDFRGTHVGGNNTGNIGIAYMGNFEIAGEFPTQEALDSVVAMWSWLSDHYGVNPDSLFGHRDYKATDCPGDNLYVELPGLRNRVRNALGFGAPYVANPAPQPFTREIPPDATIGFSLRDDEEGVDVSSVIVRINGTQVTPEITGTPSEYRIQYRPAEVFPNSQTVLVEVQASDLAQPSHGMVYEYRFKIEVEALHAEIVSPSTMRNAEVEISGQWQTDAGDVSLEGLNDGMRLIVQDNDGSHRARVFPVVAETGDYQVLMASNNTFLGESAHYRFVSASGVQHPHFAEYNRVYLRKWAPLSPTPVHFSSENPAAGYVELSGLADLDTRLMLDAFRFERVDPLTEPAAPTLKWVKLLDRAARQIEVAWYPGLEGDILGYRLFMSEDGRTWNDPLNDEQTLGPDATRQIVSYTGTSPTVYFRVVAVDTNRVEIEGQEPQPLSSPPTDIYGVGFERPADILIVDNFDRLASWRLPHHPFVRSHGEALAANGFGFDSCTETAVQTGAIDLNEYEVVVYFCGDDSRSDESLAAADQSRLMSYLEQGGKLFISGSEIGYDFDATTSAEKARYQQLLKARYLGDLSGSNRVLGASGTVFDGLDFTYGTLSSDDLYIEDFPDYILPNGGSEVAMSYDNLRIAAVQYTGKYGTSDQEAQLIYIAFTFETIESPDVRADVIGRAMQYFDITTSVQDTRAAVPKRFHLRQNYPNPFNPGTTIRYEVPEGTGSKNIKLEIFNALGQKVRTLVDDRRRSGVYRVQWDGLDRRGRRVASGVYIYRLTAGEFVAAKKMLLLQ